MVGDLVSLRLLVVSPVPEERALWCKGALFSTVPVEAVEAESAARGKALLAAGAFDLVLVDPRLPDVDGLLKAARAAETPPFVLATGEGACLADGSVAAPSDAEHACSIINRFIRVCLPSRVLVVDDSATMRSIVRKILSASRFPLEIAEAHEGAAALSHVRDGGIHIVFMDYNMPGLNGVETLAELKRQNPDLEVVIMTSADDAFVGKHARAAGAAAFLKKPFFPADIDAVLNGFYGIRAPQAA